MVAAADLRSRWHHEIAIAIQRRKAAMIRACLPSRPLRQEWLVDGGEAFFDRCNMLPAIEPEAEVT